MVVSVRARYVQLQQCVISKSDIIFFVSNILSKSPIWLGEFHVLQSREFQSAGFQCLNLGPIQLPNTSTVTSEIQSVIDAPARLRHTFLLGHTRHMLNISNLTRPPRHS